MTRSVIGFVIGLVVYAAAAIGDDKQATEIKGWGTFTDPAGDCTARDENGKLTITIPGTYHDLNPTPQFNNLTAPRILQEVEGDFQMEVRVLTFPLPKANTSTKIHSYVGAGLLVLHDDQSFVRLFRSANGESGALFTSAELFKEAKFLGGRNARTADTNTYLRIERQNDKFLFSTSGDGKAWTAIPTPEIELPKKLKVGVVAVNSVKDVFAPKFEDFKLTKK